MFYGLIWLVAKNSNFSMNNVLLMNFLYLHTYSKIHDVFLLIGTVHKKHKIKEVGLNLAS
jgi:hypothetical protein